MGGGPLAGSVGGPLDNEGLGNPIGGGFPSPAPAQVNPAMDVVLTEIRNIVSAARRLGLKFPTVLPEVRAINNSCAVIAQKVNSSGPSPEPMAPPV
jgi:hypothetical protein